MMPPKPYNWSLHDMEGEPTLPEIVDDIFAESDKRIFAILSLILQEIRNARTP